MKIQFTTEIRCAPKDVWPWLTEPERMKQWMKGLVSVEQVDPGPPRVGSVARMTIKEGGKLNVYESKLLAYEPPRRLAIRLSAPQWRDLAMECEYRLEDLGNATLLHYDFGCITSRLLFKVLKAVVGTLFGFLAKMQAKRFMKALKQCAETGGAPVRAATAA